ncbi:hypothetical protein P9B03_19205 [Metasolibacillus meyeri]|uniref:DUF4166 domain-containing protein n=1 Tax=Metasolibacillus meyeri TaxID=1071052 RepID=A0AAW9NXT0_9BACL|nr:hypothetical protein [Metasolibacillus meyeri]MEC1180594.1 hypothetical protein [Metasolibacillus meyeri]
MIYEKLLDEDFKRLHPKLQERYAQPLNEPFQATGVARRFTIGVCL